MALRPAVGRLIFLRSIVLKNILLFLVILLVAVVPLAMRYYLDSRAYEIQNLASKLEVFAKRGAAWLDVAAITTLRRPEQKRTPAYGNLLRTLRRIKTEFGVDNAIILRRQADGRYVYVAAGHDGFAISQRARIHDLFPATYKATNDTWLRGEMMHSQLFGGRVGDQVYDQFMQINMPLKLNGRVRAILMLNKFANPVAAAVRRKTIRLIALSGGTLLVGLALFGLLSARMLRPLEDLTAAAGEVAEGNLSVTLPEVRSGDEVGRLAATFRGMLEGLRQRDFIRDTFGRYLSKEVVESLLDSPDGLKMGGEAREITLLVSDLRGFTALAERLSPQQVIETLNRYLGRMVEIIMRYRGTVDEFQGDGILAFFGAPIPADDDPLRAVACALDMQIAMQAINEEQRRRRLPELAMGIGINTGEVIVGNIGSEQRAKYGAVGSAINLVYRIESHTIGGQILISPGTYERVRHQTQVRGVIEARFKGAEQPITLHDICRLEGDYQLALPEKGDEVFETLRPPLPISCFTIADKMVSATAIQGAIVRLSASGAETSLEAPVPAHANLKIMLDPQTDGALGEVYAKVLFPAGEVQQPAGAGASTATVRIVFTSLPDDARAFLHEQRRLAQGHEPRLVN